MKFPKRLRLEYGSPGEAVKVFDADSGEDLAVSAVTDGKPPTAFGRGPQPSWGQTTVTVTFTDEAGRPHRRDYPANRVERVQKTPPPTAG